MMRMAPTKAQAIVSARGLQRVGGVGSISGGDFTPRGLHTRLRKLVGDAWPARKRFHAPLLPPLRAELVQLLHSLIVLLLTLRRSKSSVQLRTSK